MTKGKKGKHKRKRSESILPYTTDQVNALIDDILEPLKKTHWVFKVVDELLKELLKKKD